MSIVYDGTMEPRPMKAVISGTIERLAREDGSVIYLDADLMSCIGTKPWADANPGQAVNCGIAEANMIGVAAGLSSMGYKPIAHSFGPFASRRCFDQVFLSCGYAKNSILVIGTDPGACAEYNGGTHMPLEDMALYRAIPDSTVVDISDASMLSSVMGLMKGRAGVNYIRTGRKLYPRIYSEDHKFEIGKAQVLRDGGDVAIFAAGIMVHEALKAAKELKKQAIDAAVIDMFTVKPLDRETLARYAARCGCAVTAENHNKIGGLYSAVCEALAETLPIPVRAVAVDNMFGEVGDRGYLMERFGITGKAIIAAAKEALRLRGRTGGRGE